MACNGEVMTQAAPATVLTIGHSTHTYEHFLALLRTAGITAIADVRSSPFSRRFPQFNGDALKVRLRGEGIVYSFLGKELGGRPRESQFFRHGVADYEAMASTDEFRRGLDRVLEGAQKYRIALMCSERHPLDCHRCLLVGRALAQRCVAVEHLLPDGAMIPQAEIEERLLQMAASDHEDLFAPREERLDAAYRDRARKVAFAKPAPEPDAAVARRA
jgi:uncharacterized protein (DUF488 family)